MEKIGFWKVKIGVKKYINSNWFNSNEFRACLEYLQTGRSKNRYKGWAKCRICGVRLGTKDMVTRDNKWLFPEGYEHYLIKHQIKPNKTQFIRDAVNWTRKYKNK